MAPQRVIRLEFLPLHFFFFFFFFLSLLSVGQSDELAILMKFKTAFQKSNTVVFDSWTPDNHPCNFTGVSCNSKGAVTRIELNYRSLVGVIPLHSLCQLPSLQKLALSANFLYGTITDALSNCSNLQYLDLGFNSFSGRFPDFSTLTKLELLSLNFSGFSGPFPWSSLANMTNLSFLSLGDNSFDAAPFPVEVLKHENLYSLYLSNCSLEGVIPVGIGNLTRLTNLELADNNLSGEIPVDIGKLTKLWQLELYDNHLTGKFPPGFGNLTALNNFDASHNHLEGDLSELRFLTNLVSLHLYENQFSGGLPEEFGDFRNLLELSLSENQLSGMIPWSIGKLKNLNILYLKNNQFSGSIPTFLISCVSINKINLAGNSFSGSIPSALGSLPVLNSLNLSNNQLSGPIPSSLSSLKLLSLLDLSNNQLSGPIPVSLAYKGYFAGNPGLCSLNINSFPPCSDSKHVLIRTVIICLVLGTTVLILSVGCFLFLKKRLKVNQDRTLSSESWEMKSFHVMSFSQNEILDSIKENNLIGKGGSGNVYRVVLSDGQELAVKHIRNDLPESKSKAAMLKRRSGYKDELEAEVATLSSIRHVNVVKLYCSITSKDSSLLVYEYMPKGSLWDRLYACHDTELVWEKRYGIALGAAKGLEYLHHGCERPVIHRDVKSSNILLDELLKPRIADFGLAKVIRGSGTTKDSSSAHVITGTCGYIAPEYAYTWKVDEKSDVYSFGVVLMELVTGKRPIEAEFGENKNIVYWVSRRIGNRKESVMGMVDPRIAEELKEDALKVLRIATMCTVSMPAQRPSMRRVVLMLEEVEPCKLISISATQDDGDDDDSEVKNKRL